MNNLIEKNSVRNQFIKSIDNQRTEQDMGTFQSTDNDDNFKRLRQTSNNWVGQSAQKTQSIGGAESTDNIEEAFAKIEAATGIRDIDELVTGFIKAEEKNFALFKFVNEMANDIEALESEVQELQA